MSASKRSPYFYSPLRVEADQKDLIISHLRDEVYLLKKNEESFYILEDQYKNLDHKYRLLNQEKAIADANFRERHELALRNINQLKNQIDALRADLRDKNLEINDLESDQNTLIGQLDQRMIEIEKLKNQLNSLLADNDELISERLRLDQNIVGVRKDNDGLLANAKNLEINNESVRRKIDDLEKYLAQLKTEESLLKEKILSFENQNNGLDADINSVAEDIGALDHNISNAHNELTILQTDIAETSGLSDKFKSEALHYHRATQAEVMKNNDSTKCLCQAENTLRLRVNQVQEGRKEVEHLRGNNDNLYQLNNQLKEDIDYCRRHLENLSLLNSDLVGNLEKYSQDDEMVRNLIDRRDRVIRARTRIQEASVLLSRSTNLEGSIRKSKLKY